jgi:hypothetical protein
VAIDLKKLLAPMRKQEGKAQLCSIVDDHNAIRLLDAFANAESAWRPRSRPKQPTEQGALWFWLWRFFLIDLDALAASARLTPEEATKLLRVLIAARLVYPDGTITRPAKTLIADFVRTRYPGRATGRPKGSAVTAKAKTKAKKDAQ